MDLHAALAALQAFLAAMTPWEALGYAGAALAVAGSAMRTMIPLRCVGIAANLVFLVYGIACGLVPTVLVNAILLPLNLSRLAQMLRLVRKVRRAAASDLSVDWLKPFMARRRVAAGETLFRRGEAAQCLFYILDGRLRLVESGLELGPGQLVGEMGFIAPQNARTQTLAVVEGGEILTISYEDLRQLYVQNPEFGFYFLRLTSRRLFENLARLEDEVARLRGDRAQAA